MSNQPKIKHIKCFICVLTRLQLWWDFIQIFKITFTFVISCSSSGWKCQTYGVNIKSLKAIEMSWVQTEFQEILLYEPVEREWRCRNFFEWWIIQEDMIDYDKLMLLYCFAIIIFRMRILKQNSFVIYKCSNWLMRKIFSSYKTKPMTDFGTLNLPLHVYSMCINIPHNKVPSNLIDYVRSTENILLEMKGWTYKLIN